MAGVILQAILTVISTGLPCLQCANGYTAIALHDLWSKTTTNYSILDQAVRACEKRQPGLINVFNDDTCWWALLCMHMYSLQGDRWFLEIARGVWESIRNDGSLCSRGQVFFKGEDMEGGVYWKARRSGDQNINAISTGLYAELSARLALAYRKDDLGEDAVFHFVETARCCLGWILRCRYRPRKGVVLDHINLKEERAVDWTFTYYTGVALGTCALLYKLTSQEEYLVLACHMAYRSMTRPGWVEDNGALTEKGAYGRGTHDPLKPNDAVGFKAVLMRQLCVLYDILVRTGNSSVRAQESMTMIRDFVSINFQSQLERNNDGQNQYGPWWNGPFEHPTSHSQMAVLDVLAAAELVDAT